MRLVIIGNGFDMHHRLKTSARDYCIFLKNNDPNVLNDIANSRYFIGNVVDIQSKEDIFWTDVEKNLRFDYNAMMDECKYGYHPYPLDESESFPDSTQLTSMEEFAEGIEKKFENIKKFTTSDLHQWIKEVNVYGADLSNPCCFKQDDIFVSFNYTKTLEDVYGINSRQVLHVHGCIDDRYSLQFGNTDEESVDVELEYKKNYGDDILFEVAIQSAMEKYVTVAEYLLKDMTENIDKLNNWLPYDDVDEVVVMGHSYNGSDFRYYEEFFVPKFRNVNWTIYCWVKKPEEAKQAEFFFRKNGLKGVIINW